MNSDKVHIFISTSFEPLRKAQADQLATILGLIGFEVMFGDEMYQESIPEGIQNRIAVASAVIGLLTRREKYESREAWATHPWVIAELVWAHSKNKPCILLLEDGVEFDGTLLGNREVIRFCSDNFAEALVTAVKYFHKSLREASIMGRTTVKEEPIVSRVIDEPIEEEWEESVKNLIAESRACALKKDFEGALKACNEALQQDPTCWRALANKGMALAHLGQWMAADDAFSQVINQFPNNEHAMARAYHNRGWVIALRDGWADASLESLEARHDFFASSLELETSRVYTRASLLICKVLLGRLDEATLLLERSLKHQGFIDVLKEEISRVGHVGHDVLRQLPRWLAHMLFPSEHPPDEVGTIE